jgi:hypothetical protein
MATTLWTYQFRGDTAANWTSVNPVLLAKELGLETDTNKFKFGDGVTAWTGLPYAGGGGGGGGVSSVALTLPSSVFTVTGSPITSSGTLTGSFNPQPVNTVFAGPASGGAGTPTFRALTIADLPGGTGTGTVTSVGLSLPAIFNVSGTPVTTSGTLTASLASQTQNMVWASPNGVAGAPTFRSIVGADLPIFGASGSSHAPGAVPDPGATAGTTRFLREDATWAVPPGGGGSGTVTSVGLALPSSVFTITGSPVTGSGTLTGTFATQTAATVFAAPAGSTGAPSFRPLVGTDVPVFGASGSSHSQGAVPDPGATAGTTRFLREDATWAVATGTDPILTSLVNGYAITDQLTAPPAGGQGFDQSTSPGGVTVSAGNTTVTTSSSTPTGVLGVAPLTGNVYFEYKLLSGTPNIGAQIGVAPLGTNLTTKIGVTDGGGSAGIVPTNNGTAYGNNGSVFFNFILWGAAVGDVVCIAYNSTTRQFWANINGGQWYNNTPSNNPVTNLGGITISGTSPLYLGITTQAAVSFQANLTSATFAYSPPSGYVAPTGGPPNNGDTYIVAPGATGAWAGQDNNLAVWYNSQWNFVVPKQGFEIYVGNRGVSRWWTGTAWADGLPINAADTLVGAVPIANGGTNATTATAARTNLGAAASGANSDITSLSGLTTALSVAQGGTGATTAAAARTNLGAGTVSSVGLSLPSIITVSGSPVAGSGTLTGTLATQSANTVFAGPTTGAAAAPTFRALVAADVPSQSGRLLNVQIFTSSGTYTPTTGTNSVIVEIQGAGGGGGGAPAVTTAQGSAGGGGGAGGYVLHRMTSGFSGASVVVGAGGSAASGASGGNGGSSSFAGITAGGGGGGGNAGPNTGLTISGGGSGGSATGGSILSLVGGLGPLNMSNNTSGFFTNMPPPAGHLGAGSSAPNVGAAGLSGVGYGSGGSGTVNLGLFGANPALSGGAGGAGVVIVWEYS